MKHFTTISQDLNAFGPEAMLKLTQLLSECTTGEHTLHLNGAQLHFLAHYSSPDPAHRSYTIRFEHPLLDTALTHRLTDIENPAQALWHDVVRDLTHMLKRYLQGESLITPEIVASFTPEAGIRQNERGAVISYSASGCVHGMPVQYRYTERQTPEGRMVYTVRATFAQGRLSYSEYTTPSETLGLKPTAQARERFKTMALMFISEHLDDLDRAYESLLSTYPRKLQRQSNGTITATAKVNGAFYPMVWVPSIEVRSLDRASVRFFNISNSFGVLSSRPISYRLLESMLETLSLMSVAPAF